MNSRGQADFSRRGSRRGSKRNIGAAAPGRTPGFTNMGNTGQGDVYTKVAMPRSKSFMNVNSQYNLQVCTQFLEGIDHFLQGIDHFLQGIDHFLQGNDALENQSVVD